MVVLGRLITSLQAGENAPVDEVPAQFRQQLYGLGGLCGSDLRSRLSYPRFPAGHPQVLPYQDCNGGADFGDEEGPPETRIQFTFCDKKDKTLHDVQRTEPSYLRWLFGPENCFEDDESPFTWEFDAHWRFFIECQR